MPNLAATEHCTGCTACASACPRSCIAMTADGDGFLFPAITLEQCVGCGLCENACPVVTPPETTAESPRAYAAYSKDEAMRLGSSSGGVFTEIAKAVLKEGGTVFGAAYNGQFEVVHVCVDHQADLAKLRGAKYAQSDLRGVFPQVKQRLEMGQQVLFSGTPCQVAGLHAYLRKGYPNLLTVDFVCHSVPSPMAWREYVKYRAQQDNGGQRPDAINLRSKKTGWTNYRYSNLFEYPDGHSHSARSGESLYMKLFVGGYINRQSCASCPFKGYQRVSDLTIGDFWGIWDIAPEMDDNKGTSVILLQSEKGKILWNELQDWILFKEVSLQQASQQNPAMLVPSKPNPGRDAAMAKIRSGQISMCADLFIQKKPSILSRFKQKITSLLKG